MPVYFIQNERGDVKIGLVLDDLPALECVA